MPHKNFAKQGDFNNPAETEHRLHLYRVKCAEQDTKRGAALLTARFEAQRVKQKSEQFVGKKVIAGGRVGFGDRVDPKTGGLYVRYIVKGEGKYHPDHVSAV